MVFYFDDDYGMGNLLLIFLLIKLGKSLNAAVFTVVSNADGDVGSLREAVSLANANETTVTDYIHLIYYYIIDLNQL